MLEDSDSEPSESEPLVQQPIATGAIRKDPDVWKSSSGKSAQAGTSSAPSVMKSRKNPAPAPPITVVSESSTVTNVKCNTNKSSGDKGVVTRNSSKRLQDLVSHLEQVPENEEPEGSSGAGNDDEAENASSEPNRAQEDPSSPIAEPSSLGCPFFGVKNYLHHFYDKPNVKDPSIYEDILPYTSDEGVFLVKNTSMCSSPVFRLSVILGALILLMGAIALTVAACSTRKSPVVAKV
ncbi:uncharacterized protein LOC108678092 [Hyalella azteca]|uniref:Uncharacterized protein LOC108678092 n=1 Tax=Hyalella azteca TaxID=294128 RepID=A0A8B7P7J8_HYAAZ|nr:uncharacterized protein LOC108678092 [Hyalella azteca]